MSSPASAPGFQIIEDDLTGAEIQELLCLHASGMIENSPAEACHFLDLDGLREPLVTLWSA